MRTVEHILLAAAAVLLFTTIVQAQTCNTSVPVVLVPASSGVSVLPTTLNGNVTDLSLRLVFRSNYVYSANTFAFVGAATTCNYPGSTVGYWNTQYYPVFYQTTPDYGTGQTLTGTVLTINLPTAINDVVSIYTAVRNSAATSDVWYYFFNSVGNTIYTINLNPGSGGTVTRLQNVTTPLQDIKGVNIWSWWNAAYLTDIYFNYYTPNCTSDYVYTATINNALTSCNFARMEGLKNATTTTFRATTLITTTQNMGSIRGLPLNSVRQTSVQVDVDVGTALDVTSTPLSIYGPRITYGRIISQTFNPVSMQATLIILTSVQSPYQLRAPTLAVVSGFTTTVVPTHAEGSDATMGVCNGTSSPVCTQYWTVTISRTNPCNPAPTTLTNSGWSLTYTVVCHSSFTGSCATPAPNTDGITFDTTSDNFCPQLIDTEAVTASLSVFSDAALSAAQSTFVFGARSYFRAVVNSPIALQALRVERVTLLGAVPSGVSTLYFSTFSNAATYFTGTPSVTYNTQPAGFTGTFAAAPSFMLMSENIAGASSLQRVANFSWIWSGATSSANTDASVSMTVSVDLRVRFANQSTVAKDHIITVRAKLPSASSITQNHLLQDVAGLSSSAEVVVQGAANNNNNDNGVGQDAGSSAAASTSSIPVFSVAVAAIGCAIALIAAITVFTMVRKIRALDNAKTTLTSQTNEDGEA